MLLCLTVPETRRTLDIVGTETISFAEWLQRMRHAQGRPSAPVLHIPYRLAWLLAHAARHLNPILQPENLRMLQIGYRADVGPLVEFLGRRPLAMAPALFFADAASSGSAS